ncbi:chemotaxis response regulator protein-glutamate methylesterase [Bradyrhizobium manausense]|uniref:protein-glutamate methylesterase/protein-glutamine glutaminase n=1 Tax=Bradyrhizobium manausense TaxID=989370 RepID=UPI001BA7D9D3|nr:chemotaxis response regulator protein-glutamate methylesterase [Bradyrhizobium manausense]MBR0833479.1 chemotaxis response regulator protein-glutamate methylesterase [Bradyrhizobium manausense]
MGSTQTDAADRSFARRKIRVLVVDDSASVRRALCDIIASDADLEVMATASDPYIAAERIRQEIPDVILLDIEMPRMDGLTFMRKIMAQRPIPVVICSSLTEEGSETTIKALEAGAVDVVSKPRVNTAEFLQESRMRICDVLRAAAHSRRSPRGRVVAPVRVEARHTADVILPAVSPGRTTPPTDPIVCIGASTGGTEALRDVLVALPAATPGIVIVQHMPEKFTAAFARRLDSLCAMSIKEAAEGDAVLPGRVLIAPGNHHMLLERAGRQYRVTIKDGPPVSRHRPSVDVLFRSAAQAAGPNAVGVILTGMGDDGARGLLEMKAAGARTIAQNEESCIVFGMPKEAIQRGAADKILPLDRIAAEMVHDARRGKGAA